MLATMTAGIGAAAIAALGLLLAGAVCGAIVGWWRRRHDEPWFAEVDALVPLELVPDTNDELEAAWSTPAYGPVSTPAFAPASLPAHARARDHRDALGEGPAVPSRRSRTGRHTVEAPTLVVEGNHTDDAPPGARRSRSRSRTHARRGAARTGVLVVLTMGLLAGRRGPRSAR